MRKNGDGSIRQLSNGKWECIIQSKYTNPDSNSLSPKRIKRTGNTELEAKKKAKQALLAWEKEFEKTRENNKIDNKRTFGSYMNEFIDTKVKDEVKGSTYMSYTYTMESCFHKYKISKLQLKNLNIVEFEVYYNTLIHDKSYKTAKVPIQLCRRCCEWLIGKSLLIENYANIAKPKKDIIDEFNREKQRERKSRKKVFTYEDIQKFYYAYKNNMSEYAPVIILILETMMRGQEVLALTMDDIDLEKNIITIRSAVSQRFENNENKHKVEPYIKVPKTDKARVVYMSPLAKEAVEYIIEQTKNKCKYNPNNFLFPSYNRHGKARSMDSFGLQFKDLCDKLGIDRDVHVAKSNGQKVGLSVHALRHTAITIANTAQNANVINTALMAGHTAIRTENIYTHQTLDSMKSIQKPSEVVLKLDENNNDDESSMQNLELLLKEKGIDPNDLIELINKKSN